MLRAGGGNKRQTNTAVRVQPPIKGIDARVAISVGDPEHCIYTFNLMPYEYGMRVRKGFREWQIDLDVAVGDSVNTIIPFDGIDSAAVTDKLFAVTNEGIWDVTNAGGTPVLVYAFLVQTPDAGWGNFAHYIGENEKDVLFYADSENGLLAYDPDTDAWAQATGITGPVVTDIRYIVLHKQRLWLIEKNSTKAWYLPIGSTSGTATEFFFGSKFKHGGALVGLYNWTVDGGEGLDDYLVAVSKAGDVLPYQGADPSSANTWELRGTYFIGEVPKGPNIGSEQGGDLYLLSSQGLTAMNGLLQGVDTQYLSANNESPNAKISSILREVIASSLDVYGWSVSEIPSEGSVIITSPRINSGPFIQYVYNMATQGWGFWRGVPINSINSWLGRVVFGTEDLRVGYMDVSVDNVTLTPPEGRLNGDAIDFSILTSFQYLDNPAHFKRVRQIRTDFLANQKPSYEVTARYDYNINEVDDVPFDGVGLESAWDTANWDRAVWATPVGQAYTDIQGQWGHGRNVAIAMRGSTRTETTLAGWDVVFITGGSML